ncbi:MAG: sulfotransferase domain-containing protein [Alphaproteobacteria bacterium]|nr:sulfotransferase domain-containing protein [Alphaproteobacteria bacterium]
MPQLVRAPHVVRTPRVDSTRWDRFEPRDGDIVIGTFSKCGTTWTQRIVDLLVFQSPEVRPFGSISPWLDSTFIHPLEDDLATLKAQTHRRYIKSHLQFDALPVWDTVKYIHVGRDGRDARLSFQNHMQGMNPEVFVRIGAEAAKLAAGDTPPALPPPFPDDPRACLLQWFDQLEAGLGAPVGADPDYFDFEATYWRERRRSNLLLVHYDDLKADLAGEMRRISDFLEIATPESLMGSLVEAARFESMKKHGDALFPELNQMFDRGADRFINKGRSGRWREVLTPEDVARYEAIMARAATPGLARWLEHGRKIAGDPRASAD